MIRTLKITALFAVITLTLAAHTSRMVDAAPGQIAPDIELKATTETTEDSTTPDSFFISDLKGEYVLINFWSTTDAASRVAAGTYDQLMKTNDFGGRLNLLNLNFDGNAALFDAVVRQDGLDTAMQYHLSGEAADEVAKTYHLDQGYRAILIDPNGKIVAVNPTPADITTHVS
ncbi:MAG: thioredoxin family protein [Muribaculaceae bacterium]|nr:thioredoxin family protein [Muribaculaceae bacterium]